jgi:hypothetical protein
VRANSLRKSSECFERPSSVLAISKTCWIVSGVSETLSSHKVTPHRLHAQVECRSIKSPTQIRSSESNRAITNTRCIHRQIEHRRINKNMLSTLFDSFNISSISRRILFDLKPSLPRAFPSISSGKITTIPSLLLTTGETLFKLRVCQDV